MPKSKFEESLFDLLRDEYKNEIIICQQSIKPWGERGKTLYLDYLVPSLRLAFEADGRQHDAFVPFYHKNVSGFERSVANDEAKSDWCKANKVTLIRFSSKETIDQETLRTKIKEAVLAKKSKSKPSSK
jgi:very-short-patch-repair endonuclease